MLRIQTLFFGFFLLLIATSFVFVQKTYADDPCAPITDPPNLYQIKRTSTQATLFFTPIANDQVQSYTILYGLKPEDERYSITINQGPSTGAITATINDLQKGVPYYFKVMGNTSCVSSPWSSWVGDTVVKKSSNTSPAVPVTGAETLYLWSACSFLLILSGLGFFVFSKRRI